MTGAGTTMMPSDITGTTNAPGDTATNAASNSSISNGQQSFLYATGNSGLSITFTGGPSTMMQGPFSCATCQGVDGHGGTIYVMMRSYQAPDITWAKLSGPDPDMQHPPYTEATLKRAITEGLDPGGNPLSYPMTRW